jgi:hypothetical protein
MHIAIVSVNHALLTSPLGDDVTVLRSLGAEVDRLSVIVATPHAHQARSLSSNVSRHSRPTPDPTRRTPCRSLGPWFAYTATKPLDLIQA